MKAITLANLADSTDQEVFDWIVSNLLKQGKRSTKVWSKESECDVHKDLCAGPVKNESRRSWDEYR